MSHAMGQQTSPPRAASTVYFRLDDDGDVLAARPAPLVEVRPQEGEERHCGSGFELLLSVTVPQMGRELVEVPNLVSQVVEQNVDMLVRCMRCLCFLRLWWSTSHPCQQWFLHLCQWWNLLHPHQQCFFRIRQWWSPLHPRQRCPNRQRQLRRTSHLCPPCRRFIARSSGGVHCTRASSASLNGAPP